MNDTRAVPIRRPFSIRVRVSAKDLEMIRIAAAKQGLAPAAYVYRVALDAALKAA